MIDWVGVAIVLCVIGIIVSTVAVSLRRFQYATETEAPPIRSLPYPAGTPHAPEPIAVPLRTWLDRVNNQPDKVPHIAATGYTGSGKTTLVTAVLSDRPGQLAIFTPKRDDYWGGAQFVTLDDDLSFQSIARGLEAVYEELKRRNVQPSTDWLTVVIDDYPWIAKECKRASDIVTIVGNMGRSVRVRLVLLAQQRTVKAWGFEGNGEARANFVFLDIDESHHATIARWGKDPEPIDTRYVKHLADRARLIGREWEGAVLGVLEEPAQPVAASPLVRGRRIYDVENDAPIRKLVETAVESSEGAEPSFQAQGSDFTISNFPFTIEETARIVAQIIAGNGKTEIVKAMPRYAGRRHAEFAAIHDKLKTAIEKP